jgi:hypothetical protein
MPHILEDALDFEVMHSLRRLILKVCLLVYSAAAFVSIALHIVYVNFLFQKSVKSIVTNCVTSDPYRWLVMWHSVTFEMRAA